MQTVGPRGVSRVGWSADKRNILPNKGTGCFAAASTGGRKPAGPFGRGAYGAILPFCFRRAGSGGLPASLPGRRAGKRGPRFYYSGFIGWGARRLSCVRRDGRVIFLLFWSLEGWKSGRVLRRLPWVLRGRGRRNGRCKGDGRCSMEESAKGCPRRGPEVFGGVYEEQYINGLLPSWGAAEAGACGDCNPFRIPSERTQVSPDPKCCSPCSPHSETSQGMADAVVIHAARDVIGRGLPFVRNVAHCAHPTPKRRRA